MADQRIFDEAVFRAAVTRFEVNSDPASAQRIVTGVGQVLRMLDAARAEVERLREQERYLQETTDAARNGWKNAETERGRLVEQVERVERIRVWTNEDGKGFVFADDLRTALDRTEAGR